jgi:UDP-N-acetylmuramate dehydrogenase
MRNVTDMHAGAIELPALDGLMVRPQAPLSAYTRFGIGGPADLLADTDDPETFAAVIRWLRERGMAYVVLGGGTNLVVSDEGFRGVVLRYTNRSTERQGIRVSCGAGAELMDLVRFTVDAGLEGVQTLMGIPGWVGAAIYGNAGAYGHSIEEVVERVHFFDGDRVRSFSREECEFRYRESIFKRHKGWIILRAELQFRESDREALRQVSGDILETRNQKFPPTMRCAGSIVKNLHVAELPAAVVAEVPQKVIREGKIPAAWFLEQVGAKGAREGDIQVADYHANLIYNAGQGTAAELCRMIARLKQKVRERFGFSMEEEVQYVGFAPGFAPR